MKEMLGQPFFQVTLPLMVTFVATVWAATWAQNKRIDDLAKRFEERFAALDRRIDEIIKRLERIELKLENYGERITRIEERTSRVR